MRRYALILAGILMSLSMIAQDFSWGFNLYPNFSNRRLMALDASISQNDIRRLDSLERGKFSLGAGLQAGWRGEKLGFRFGLGFSETGYQTIQMNIPGDTPNPDNATENKFVYRNFNILLPVEFEFVHNLDTRNSFLFILGATGILNVGNEVKEIRYFGDTSERQDAALPEAPFRRLHFAIQSGMGWENHLSESTTIFLQPTFHFWLGGLFDNTDVSLNRSLYDIGVKVGVRFQQ